MAHATRSGSSKTALRQQEAREAQLLYWVCFVIFLVGTAVARLLPWQHKGSVTAISSTRRSIFAEAKASASTLIPFAFMK